MLDTLLTLPEGKTLEFKRNLSSPKPFLKTPVAFANTAGGRLVIGVEDDKQVTGVEDPLAEEERLCNLIADSIVPRLVPNIELVTIEDMKEGVSRIRNPVIARVFRELNLVEQWGSGVRRIFEDAVAQSLPAPEIVEIGMRVRFIVKLAKPISVPSTQSWPESATQSNEPIVQMLQVLKHGTLSSGNLRTLLNLKHRPTFRTNYLHPALEAGYIELTIPEKPQSRLQKYRLTAQGRSLLEK